MKLSALSLLAAMSEQRKALLTQKYNCTPEQMSEVEKADPTASGTYGDWILLQWLRNNAFHLPEDAEGPAGLKSTLRKFDLYKNKAAWKASNSSDILSYTYKSLQEAILAFKDPDEIKVPEVSAPIIYQNGENIVWKVPEGDWQSLNTLGKAGKAGWCTAQENPSYAKHYISTGPIYVCYVNGKPYFQYMPGGKASNGNNESPQFMDRFNTTFMRSTMMDEKSYNILKDIPSEPDLVSVTERYRPPDMSEAGTLKYLADILSLDKDYWKKNPEFKEKELTFIKNKYPHLDPDELLNLSGKYPRAGEVSKSFGGDNPHVSRIAKQLESFTNLKDINDELNKDTLWNSDEKSLILSLPFLFDKIFTLFRKETNFDEDFNRLKVLVKQKDVEALVVAGRLVNLLTTSFKNYKGYRDEAKIVHYGADKAIKRYVNIVISIVRPELKGIYDNIAKTISERSALETKNLLNTVSNLSSSVFIGDFRTSAMEVVAEKSKEITTLLAENKLKGADTSGGPIEFLETATKLNGEVVNEFGENNLTLEWMAPILKNKLENRIETLQDKRIENVFYYLYDFSKYHRGYITNLGNKALKVAGEVFLPYFLKELDSIASSGMSLTDKLASVNNAVKKATTLLSIESGKEQLTNFVTGLLREVKESFDLIKSQKDSLSLTDYLALIFNNYTQLIQVDLTEEWTAGVAEYFKSAAEVPIKQQLQTINKLKWVDDQIEAWGLSELPWVIELKDERKNGIRESKPKPETQRMRFAPKEQFEKWIKDNKSSMYSDGVPAPSLDSRVEDFILKSPSFSLYQVISYFMTVGKDHPGFKNYLIEKSQFSSALEYLELIGTWPELGDVLLNELSPFSEMLDSYSKLVYGDAIWPDRDALVIGNLTASVISKAIDYANSRGQSSWPDLDEAIRGLAIRGELFRDWAINSVVSSLIEYYTKGGQRIGDRELEGLLCKNHIFAESYLLTLVPRSKIIEILDRMDEGKKASLRGFRKEVLLNRQEQK